MKNLYLNELMKKRNQVLVLLLIVSTSVCAQALCFSTNGLQSSDCLYKQQVGFRTNGWNEKSRIWDLREMELIGKKFRSIYASTAAGSDTIVCAERQTRTYLRQQNDSLLICRSEDHLMRIDYDLPELWLRFPMQQGDSISGYFNGTGYYCDKLFLHRFGTYKTKTIPVETLILPDGDSVKNVLLLHTQRYIIIHGLDDTMQSVVPKFTVDSIIRHMQQDSVLVCEEVCRLYVPHYRYPVLETKAKSLSTDPVRTIVSEMYYIPIDEQDYQPGGAADDKRNEDEGGNATRSDFLYTFIQNRDGQYVEVCYEARSAVSVKAVLCNVQGMVLKTVEATGVAGWSSLRVDCQGLPRGQYILYINANASVCSEKFNIN